MSPLWFPIAAIVVTIAFVLFQGRRSRADVERDLEQGWGRPRLRQRDMEVLAAYHRMCAQRTAAVSGPSPFIDDRTWTDLTMDEVFAHLDRADSLVGQQVFYHRLRSASSIDDAPAFDRLATRLGDDQPCRVAARLALSRLGASADAADLANLADPDQVAVRPWHVVFPVIGVAMMAGVAATAFWPAAIFGLAAGTIVNIALRATVARDLRVSARAFRQINPLLGAAASLTDRIGADISPLTTTLGADVQALAPLKRVAAWVGRERGAAASGELGGVIVEYFNLLFCLDGNALYFGARHLREHGSALLRVIQAVGTIDAAASVAHYRAGLTAWARPIVGDPDTAISLAGVRHPLIADAVPNSITLKPPYGMLVTGSNMSGKSTFLRTLGVSVLLAQSIATCEADAYAAPRLIVRTCIGMKDDITSGKSYYLAEVEAVLELVAATKAAEPHLILFDELFRGTNAVERIAAGEAVLATMTEPADGGIRRHVVVGATHDLELVDLLAGRYAAFHFSDRIDEAGLSFDYRLVEGPATTRNAIALLRVKGAPDALVARAMARAAELDRARVSRLPSS